MMKLDKKLLKRYFEEHPHENLPDFSDNVQFQFCRFYNTKNYYSFIITFLDPS